MLQDIHDKFYYLYLTLSIDLFLFYFLTIVINRQQVQVVQNVLYRHIDII